MSDVVDQCPADAATRSRVDEAILRTSVERIFAVDKLGVEHHVALLRARAEVGQALPRDEILRAGDAGCGRRGREVAGLRVVMALGTEDAVDPSVLMGSDAHIIDIRCRNDVLGHRDGLRPEAEVVDAVGTLGRGEERLAVGTLHTDNEHILVMPLDGAAVERGVHHDALHQVGVVLLTEVIAPFQGRMVGRQDGVLILLINTVLCIAERPKGRAAPLFDSILTVEQCLMVCTQGCHFLFKFSHIVSLISDIKTSQFSTLSSLNSHACHSSHCS